MYLQVIFVGSELEAVAHLHDSVTYDYRRYTYWADGRRRWRVGDRVLVPTHDGTDEAEAMVVSLERGDWPGPYDSVIERVHRATPVERPRWRLPEDLLPDYAHADVVMTQQMVASMRDSVERQLERELVNGGRTQRMILEDGVRVLDPGRYVGRITDVREDDRGLVVTAQVEHPRCTSTDQNHACEEHPCAWGSEHGAPCGRITPHVHSVAPSDTHEMPLRVTSYTVLEPANGEGPFVELEFSDGSRREVRAGETIEQRSAPMQDLYSWQSPFPLAQVATGYPEVRIIDEHGVASPWYEVVPAP